MVSHWSLPGPSMDAGQVIIISNLLMGKPKCRGKAKTEPGPQRDTQIFARPGVVNEE